MATITGQLININIKQELADFHITSLDHEDSITANIGNAISVDNSNFKTKIDDYVLSILFNQRIPNTHSVITSLINSFKIAIDIV